LPFAGLAVFVAFVLMYGFDTNKTQRVSGGGTHVVSITLTDFDVTPGTLGHVSTSKPHFAATARGIRRLIRTGVPFERRLAVGTGGE
jgi:hypothetical protein